MDTKNALTIIVSILQRAPINAAEQFALNAALAAINEAITKIDAPKQE